MAMTTVSETPQAPPPAGQFELSIQEALGALAAQWHDEAILACERAFRERPGSAEAIYLFGLVAFDLDEPLKGLAFLEKAHERNPDIQEFAEALAAAYARVGKINEGLFYAKLATALAPHPTIPDLLPERFGSFFANLRTGGPHRYRQRAGRRLKAGNLAKAAADCELQLELTPGDTQTLRILARTSLASGRSDRAISAFHAVLHEGPPQPADLSGLAAALAAGGRYEEALACHAAALARAPDQPELHSRLLATLLRRPGVEAREIADAHMVWQSRHGSQIAARALPRARDRDSESGPERPLRVGYLSGSFHNSELMEIFQPILKAHDRSRIEPFCYADQSHLDITAEALIRSAARWTDITGIDDETLWEILRGDKIDILVDLTGHDRGGRPLMLARRPAPVAVSWLGYPQPPGVPAVDHFLTDAVAWPHEWSGPATGEALWRLPGTGFAYRAPGLVPDVGPLPAAKAGYVTFGASADLGRIGASTAALWAEVLEAVENSRLLICNRFDQDQTMVERCLEQFCHMGLRQRVDVVNLADNFASPFEFYHHVDLALDSGAEDHALETCRALWMGVPVLTLAGKRHATRLAASALNAAGHPDWVAQAPAELAGLAARLGADHGALTSLRAALRDQVAGSALADVAGFARSLEEAYQAMWRRHCAARPRP